MGDLLNGANGIEKKYSSPQSALWFGALVSGGVVTQNMAELAPLTVSGIWYSLMHYCKCIQRKNDCMHWTFPIPDSWFLGTIHMLSLVGLADTPLIADRYSQSGCYDVCRAQRMVEHCGCHSTDFSDLLKVPGTQYCFEKLCDFKTAEIMSCLFKLFLDEGQSSCPRCR